jgi:hypothetical protein
VIAKHDRAVLALLERHASPQPWWLGYLETGASDIIFDDAPRVRPYAVDWRYVLVEAYPKQAATWRGTTGDEVSWKGTELPDVIFPQDRSWLLSTLWDDDWSCIGGPQALLPSCSATLYSGLARGESRSTRTQRLLGTWLFRPRSRRGRSGCDVSPM